MREEEVGREREKDELQKLGDFIKKWEQHKKGNGGGLG